jgi:hypothetical protein
MHHEFSCELICTFLSPFELLRFRTLSNFHNSCAVKYLKRYFEGKTDLQNFVCPCCGDWLPREDFLTGYSGFYNIFDEGMAEEIYEYIMSALEERGLFEVSRRALLCDACELTETEIPYKTHGYVEMSVNHNRHLHKFFRFKGDRIYKTIFHNDPVYQWAVVYQKVGMDDILWNEYRCIQEPYSRKGFIY